MKKRNINDTKVSNNVTVENTGLPFEDNMTVNDDADQDWYDDDVFDDGKK